MAKKRITVTVDDDVASYLHDQLNTSAVVYRDLIVREIDLESGRTTAVVPKT